MLNGNALRSLIVGVTFAVGIGSSAVARDYPSETIRIIVPYSAGASTDNLSRLLGKDMAEDLKVPVVAENRTGAGGSIAADYVKRQPADGYAFMLTTDGILSTNPAIYKNLTYDALKDFTPLTIAARIPLVLVVNTNSPFKTANELIDYAKANPGKLSYGSAGIGTSQHMAGELMKNMADVDITHIPYRGGAPAMTDLLGGHHDMMHVQTSSAKSLAEDGKIRILAIGSAERSKILPDVPTFDEIGLKGYDSDTWYGFNMPAGADPKVQKILSDSLIRAIHKNSDHLESLGFTIYASSPEEMTQNVITNQAKWADIAKKGGFYHAN